MAEINIILKGVVKQGLRRMTADVAVMSLFVTKCVMHNKQNVKWSFPAAPSIAITVRDMSGVSAEDREALTSVGSAVTLRIFGDFNDYRIEIVSAVKHSEQTLENFLVSLV